MATVPAAPRTFGGCACQRHTGIDCLHRGAFHFAEIPQDVLLLVPAKDPARCLPCAARTVPEKPRLYNQCRWDFSDIRFSDGLRSFPQLIS